MRLTRRAVRDYNFRGTDVEDTLEIVGQCAPGGEAVHLPLQEPGGYHLRLLPSPMTVSVMKNYALPLLQAVPEENVRRAELLELIEAFQYFEPIAPELVDQDSLLREFIGGGSYTTPDPSVGAASGRPTKNEKLR